MESAPLAHLMSIPWDSCKENPLGSMRAFELETCRPPRPLAGSCWWFLLLAHRPPPVSKQPSTSSCDTSPMSLTPLRVSVSVFRKLKQLGNQETATRSKDLSAAGISC